MVHVVIAGARPAFPDRLEPNEYGLAAVGGRLDTDTLCEAYRKGLFPWTGEHPIPWYSPDPRCVLPPRVFHASRSLRKLARSGELEVAFDRDFAATIRGCADAPRPDHDDTWILPNVRQAYTELYRLGIAHSVEVYRDGALVGGLYGLCFGAGFFGESMFSRRPNASKLALWALCRALAARGFAFVDCQAVTPHLQSLGAELWPRERYLPALARALDSDAPGVSAAQQTRWTGWSAPPP